MSGFVDLQIQDLENKLENLRDKLDSISDNNHYEQSRVQLKITEITNEINNLKSYKNLLSKQKNIN